VQSVQTATKSSAGGKTQRLRAEEGTRKALIVLLACAAALLAAGSAAFSQSCEITRLTNDAYEDLEIRIFAQVDLGRFLQVSHFRVKSADCHIDASAGQYISSFETGRTPSAARVPPSALCPPRCWSPLVALGGPTAVGSERGQLSGERGPRVSATRPGGPPVDRTWPPS
jgi:hypothetical protein